MLYNGFYSMAVGFPFLRALKTTWFHSSQVVVVAHMDAIACNCTLIHISWYASNLFNNYNAMVCCAGDTA